MVWPNTRPAQTLTEYVKVHIRGFSRDCPREILLAVFSKYGTMKRLWIKPLGTVGFIMYSNMEEAESAVADSPVTVAGENVYVMWPEDTPKKVFVGGLAPTVTEDEISTALDQFGPIMR